MARKKQTRKKTVAKQKSFTKRDVAKKSVLNKSKSGKSAIKKTATQTKNATKRISAKQPIKQRRRVLLHAWTLKRKAAKQPIKQQASLKKRLNTSKHPFKKPEIIELMHANFKHSLKSMADDNGRAIKRKRTGKEIAVIAISIAMIVSILLPSFTVLFGKNQSEAPNSFTQTQEMYQPKIDELQKKVASNPSSADDRLDLADTTYRYGQYAMQLAATDEETNQAKNIMKEAAEEYTAYLSLVRSLETYEEKNAVVSRALCNLYIENDNVAVQQLQDLLKETNFAPAWQALGMIYESGGKNNQAIDAYQKAIESPQDPQQDVTSYCQSRINALKAANAESSGGAPALNAQLDS